jgi:hypothetical protein
VSYNVVSEGQNASIFRNEESVVKERQKKEVTSSAVVCRHLEVSEEHIASIFRVKV